MVVVITKKTIKEETAAEKRTYDLVVSISANRLCWLGLVLRMKEGCVVKTVVQQINVQRTVKEKSATC